MNNPAYSRTGQAARKAFDIVSAVLFARQYRAKLGQCVYLDVGARGGLSKKWRALYRFDIIVPVLFEPDPEEAAKLRRSMPKAVVNQTALADSEGEATLYITRDPGCSSLLEPLPDLAQRYGRDDFEVAREICVKTSRLDAMREGIPQPDFIKLDVQGLEMQILSGGRETLDKVLCAEVETRLVPHYRGEALFPELYAFMKENGFGLVAFRPLGLYKGEILEGNAYFSRQPTNERDALKIRLWQRLMSIPTSTQYGAMSS